MNTMHAPPVKFHRRYGPTARTATLCVLGLLSGLTMTITTFAGLQGADRASDELTAQTLPAATALRAAVSAGLSAQEAFLEAVETQDPVARSQALVRSVDAGRRQDVAWSSYERVALNGADERALHGDYEVALTTARQLAAAVVSAPLDDPTRPAKLTEERRESAAQIAALGNLEARYAPVVQRHAAAIGRGIDRQLADIVATYAFLAVLFTGIGVALLRGARHDQRQLTSEAAALRVAGEHAAFEGALQRGLEMAPTEESSFDIVSQALSMVADDAPTELLLADSSKSHLCRVVGTGANADMSCSVGTPQECAAVRTGQTRVFSDSAQLDTCRFLRGQPEPVWAVCVPVSIAGQATGVLHTQDVRGRGMPERLVPELELVAQKAGERIGALRVFARTEAQAQVDPLTGLANRRTLEARAREMLVLEEPYVVLFADLDHFKLINDSHGHETGDRALRLFSRVLRKSIRPGDLLARYGGEEFVAVLPVCVSRDARLVAERIRSELAAALGDGTVPSFTVTVGVAESQPGEELADVVARADVAMLHAKSQGRDCVLVAGEVSLASAPY